MFIYDAKMSDLSALIILHKIQQYFRYSYYKMLSYVEFIYAPIIEFALAVSRSDSVITFILSIRKL